MGGHDGYTVNLEHPAKPEGKEVLRKKDGGMSQGHRRQLEGASLPKCGTV